MTLVISQISPAFALQVTDRLVVKKCVNGFEKFDPVANKNVIFGACDAIVSIGYTGRAFMGQIPTDSWIAAQLSGIDVSEKFAARLGSLPQWLDIGHAMRVLHAGLTHELRNTKEAFELLAVGWKWHRRKQPLSKWDSSRRVIPMFWRILKPYARPPNEIETLPRNWYMQNRVFISASPAANYGFSKLPSLSESY